MWGALTGMIRRWVEKSQWGSSSALMELVSDFVLTTLKTRVQYHILLLHMYKKCLYVRIFMFLVVLSLPDQNNIGNKDLSVSLHSFLHQYIA